MTALVEPSSDIAVWGALRRAVREAHQLGAKFYIVGAAVEIDGELPGDLRVQLPEALLRDYLGAEADDNAALDFLDQLGVETALVEDIAGAEAAMVTLDGADVLSLDVETSPPGARLAPVRLTRGGTVSATQPTPDGGGLDPHRANIMTLQLYTGGDRAYVLRGDALSYVLGSHWLSQQHLVAHNAAFELTFLQQHSTLPDETVWRRPIECTMQATGLLHGVGRRSLAMASLYTLGIEPPKALQTSCWAAPRLSVGQVAYAAADAILAHRLWQAMRPVLAEKGRLTAYELQRDAIPAVADMQRRGLGFDRAEHARQVASWSRELADARHTYLQLTGKAPPSSPAEIRAWLTEVAGELLPNWHRTDTGELSIERKRLKRLALSDVPTVKPVLQMLAMTKLISTFGSRLAEFVSPVTGRVHAGYNIAATKSGRFSSSKPNLQQLPSARAPDFRRAIVAAPGNVLVGGDWSQIELRAAAWISGDPELTAVFRDGRDLHSETAAAISGVSVSEVTKAQRSAAKAVNFGSIYGIGPRSLAENAFDAYGIEMSEQQAREALDRFFRRHSTLQSWMREHAALCQARGYVKIGVGRIVDARWEPGGQLSFQQTCNLPVQGAAADAMLRALPIVYRRLRDLRGGLIATVHDEILIEVAEADAECARAVLEETMIQAFEMTFPGAPTGKVVEVKISTNWAEVKS